MARILPALTPMSAYEWKVNMQAASKVRISYLVNACPVNDQCTRDHEVDTICLRMPSCLTHAFSN